MVIGARIRNEGGSLVQIDPFFESMCLKTTGVQIQVPSYTVPGGATIGKVTITEAGCKEPLIAFFSGTSAVGVMSKSQSGSTYSWEVITNLPNATITYWILDTTDVAQIAFPITKGLRIRNPNNNAVVFDSRYKYMRVMKQIDADVRQNVVNDPIELTSGYAVAVTDSGLYVNITGGPVGGGPSWITQNSSSVAGVICNSNGTVTSRLIGLIQQTRDGPSNPPPTGQMGSGRFQGLVLDMRNY